MCENHIRMNELKRAEEGEMPADEGWEPSRRAPEISHLPGKASRHLGAVSFSKHECDGRKIYRRSPEHNTIPFYFQIKTTAMG